MSPIDATHTLVPPDVDEAAADHSRGVLASSLPLAGLFARASPSVMAQRPAHITKSTRFEWHFGSRDALPVFCEATADCPFRTLCRSAMYVMCQGICRRLERDRSAACMI